MLSISTAYNIHKSGSWRELLSSVKSLGFSSIELNVEVPSAWIEDIENSVKKGEITVSSLHNYCPRLESLPKGKSIYFAYSLASIDEEERKTAVELTTKTIETAKRVNAKAVVIHSGDIPISPSGRDIFSYAQKFGRNARLYQHYKDDILKQRQERSKDYFESLKKSIEQVSKACVKNKISIGLETRIYYNEIPIIEEFEELFEKFSGAPVFYWHDTGHAEVNVRLGFVKEHEDFLKAFGHRLLGTHLHDLKGLDDHYAPGSGDFDFKKLLPYLRNDTIKVVEAHKKASPKQVKNSIKYLEKIGV